MASVDWNHKIHNYRGAFLPSEVLDGESYVQRLLAGVEPWEPAEEDIENGLPEYEERIEEIRRECEQEKREQKDATEINQKVAEQASTWTWVPLFRRPCQFPRKSHWNQEQQRFVVNQLIKYWATGIPSNPPRAEAKDVDKLMKFIEGMRPEQEEFFAFAREVNKTQLERYTHRHQIIDAYMRKRLLTNHSRVRLYPSLYKSVSMLPLAPDPVETGPPLRPVGEPLELGEVPVLIVPQMRRPTNLRKQAKFLEVFHPSTGALPRPPGCHPGKGGAAVMQAQQHRSPLLYKIPVSQDPNVAFLAPALDFTCVLTPSVWKTLLDNAPPWDKQWDIPVTVRDVPCRIPGQTRRVAFLDKPLPARCITTLQKRAMALKRMVRILTCKRHHGGDSVDYSRTEQISRRETEGKEKQQPKNKKKKQKKKRQLTRTDTQESEENNTSVDVADSQGSQSTVGAPMSAVVADESDDTEDSDDDGLKIDYEEGPKEHDEGVEAESVSDRDPPTSKRPRTEGGSGHGSSVGHKDGMLDSSKPEEPALYSPEPLRKAPFSPPMSSASLSPQEYQPTSLTPDPTTAPSRPPGNFPPGKPPPFPHTSQKAHTIPPTPSASPPPHLSHPTSHPPASHPTAPSHPPGGSAQTTTNPQSQSTSAKPRPQQHDLRRPPTGMNVKYRVWQLGNVQMLVRSSTHGMRESAFVGGLVRYSVHAKPAYQAYYGIEVMTRAELISQWADCVLRHNSRLLRVHVEPVTLNVCMLEERTLKQLTDEFIKYDTRFRPQYALQVLESLLVELPSLEPGQYLLSHDTRAGAFARLFRAADHSDIAGYNLRQSFGSAPREAPVSQPPPCLNIDPSVLTPYNIVHGRVPATFDYHILNGMSWKEYWGKKNEAGIKRMRRKKPKDGPQEQQSQEGGGQEDNSVSVT